MPHVFDTQRGPLCLHLLGHGSVMLEWDGLVIYIDPYSQATSFSGLSKADQIWITHHHFDHLDLTAIRAVATPDTRFVADALSADQLTGQVHVMRNGDRIEIDQIKLEAVPAYNVVRERTPGEKYHPQGMGNGYVATLGDVRLYIAGDTEAIPEMNQLKDIDMALLPVMLPYTMSSSEAAQAARTIKPTTVLPYHTTPNAAQDFATRLAGSGIEVLLAKE